jgi:hypothetical protein
MRIENFSKKMAVALAKTPQNNTMEGRVSIQTPAGCGFMPVGQPLLAARANDGRFHGSRPIPSFKTEVRPQFQKTTFLACIVIEIRRNVVPEHGRTSEIPV